MENKEIIKKIKSVCYLHPEIKLAYLFGSQASGKIGPLSDFDFAFYIQEKEVNKLFDLKFILSDEISRSLGTDKVDVVILNLVESPELKYNIIKDGELIFVQEPFKVLIEPRIIREYFDFHDILTRHHLTKA